MMQFPNIAIKKKGCPQTIDQHSERENSPRSVFSHFDSHDDNLNHYFTARLDGQQKIMIVTKRILITRFITIKFHGRLNFT